MNHRIDIDVREGTVSHNMGRIEVLLLAFYIPYLSVQLAVNNLLCKTSCTYAIGLFILASPDTPDSSRSQGLCVSARVPENSKAVVEILLRPGPDSV